MDGGLHLLHMLGPFIASSIDTTSDRYRVIVMTCLAYATVTALMTATFGHVPLLLTALLLIAAGLCNPRLRGGISTFPAGHCRARPEKPTQSLES